MPVDVFGTGEDMEDIKKRAEEYKLDITFHPGTDHLDEKLHAYRYLPYNDHAQITDLHLCSSHLCQSPNSFSEYLLVTTE